LLYDHKLGTASPLFDLIAQKLSNRTDNTKGHKDLNSLQVASSSSSARPKPTPRNGGIKATIAESAKGGLVAEHLTLSYFVAMFLTSRCNMSDGPHRSLPMRPAWRGLAARADNSNHTREEVADALARAVRSDFRNEVSPAHIGALRRIFDRNANSLGMPEIALAQLREAAPLASGSVFGQKLHEWATIAASDGRLTRDALHEAVGNAAIESTYAGIRQTSEHYVRQSTERRAMKVEGRMRHAATLLNSSNLGASLLAPAGPKHSLRRAGLDDGVAIHA
jgi:hypothetical protein